MLLEIQAVLTNISTTGKTNHKHLKLEELNPVQGDREREGT